MADESKITDGKFKKRAHRPWKTSLLETAVEAASLEPADKVEAQELALDIADLNLDLETDFAMSLPTLYSSFNFSDDFDSQPGVTIEQTKDQNHQFSNSSSSVVLGSFLQPQDSNSLDATLRISEALDKAKRAEINYQAAETRLLQTIEQLNTAQAQCRKLTEQINQATQTRCKEEQLRIEAERQIKLLNIRIENIEQAYKNEQQARTTAEEKIQRSLGATTNAELISKQLRETQEQLQQLTSSYQAEEARRLATIQQNEDLNRAFVKIEAEHKESYGKIFDLENSVRDLSARNQELDKKASEATAQRDKLKSIIEGEQKLRKAVEKRAQEAVVKAHQAIKARQISEQQKVVVEERAQRAVEHANNTIMHLLNTPLADKQNQAKIKIRIPNDPIKQALMPEEDDYSF